MSIHVRVAYLFFFYSLCHRQAPSHSMSSTRKVSRRSKPNKIDPSPLSSAADDHDTVEMSGIPKKPETK